MNLTRNRILSSIGLAAAALLLSLGFGLPAGADGHTSFTVTITNNSDPEMPIAPGAYVISSEADALWAADSAASEGVEAIAEEGDPSTAVEAGATQIGDGPIQAGESYTFTIEAAPGDHLSTVNMLVFTNDAFVGVNSVALFDDEGPITIVDRELNAYDAGTEENEEISSGIGQPAGEAPDGGHGTGTATEGGVISSPHEQFSGPQATISIQPVAAEESMSEGGEASEDSEGGEGSEGSEDSMELPQTGTGGLADAGSGFAPLAAALAALVALAFLFGAARFAAVRRR